MECAMPPLVERLVSDVEYAALFGEDQGRYLVSCTEAEAAALVVEASAAGVPAARIGTTGGTSLILSGQAPITVAEIRRVRDGWMPRFMAGARAEAAE